jgi:endonuclease III
MTTPNRGTRITKVLGQIKKHFKPANVAKNRTLIEHLLFACLLENSSYEAADTAFNRLVTDYFDWNEVRVSTKRELAETLKELNDPEQAAERLKRTLHSVFESVYVYDLEHLKKQNLGQATKTIEKYEGTSPFTVAYVTQNALGGHAIPANQGLLIAFVAFDLITEKEASQWHIPGLERAVPKSKGTEMSTILHQLGVEVGKSPYGPNTKKLLLAIDPECKTRLPKKPEPKQAPAPVAPPAPVPPQKPVTKQPAKPAPEAPAPVAAPDKKKKIAAPPAKPVTKSPSTKAPAPAPAPKKKVKKKVVKTVKKKVAKKTSGGSTGVKKKPAGKPTKKITKRKPK